MFKLKSFLIIGFSFVVLFNKAQVYGGTLKVGKQKSSVAVTAGDIKAMKDVKRVNIVYDYSTMSVGDFPTEKAYLDSRAAELDKKEAGKGNKFKESWEADRKKRFEPKFQELFNSTGSKTGLVGTNYTSDAYVTLKVSTTMTEPGFNTGVVKKLAYVNLECSFVDKNNQEILHYSIKNAQGQGSMDFMTGARLGESYAKGAKMLVKDLKKKLSKLK